MKKIIILIVTLQMVGCAGSKYKVDLPARDPLKEHIFDKPSLSTPIKVPKTVYKKPVWEINCDANEFTDKRSCYTQKWFQHKSIRITLDAEGPHVRIGFQDWYDDFGLVRIDKYPAHTFNEMKKGMEGKASYSSQAQYANIDFSLDGFSAAYSQLVQRWKQWSNESASTNPISETP